MNNKMGWLCCFVGFAALNCGGSPLDQSSETDNTKSDLIMSTVAKRNPDGTYAKTTIYQTRAEYDAEVAARDEMIRLRKAGTKLAEAPPSESEIQNGSCASNYSLWLWPNTGASGPINTRCCLVGTGDAPLWTMCNFPVAHSLKTSGYAAWYNDDDWTCGDSVPPADVVYDTYCDASWAGQGP